MTIVEEPICDIATRRERELKRVSWQDIVLEKELDDLCRSLQSDEPDGPDSSAAMEAVDAKSGSDASQPTIAGSMAEAKSPLAAPEPYFFPDTAATQCDIVGLSNDGLRNALKQLAVGPLKSKTLQPYHEIRDRHCAISVIMNERGVVPPRFRYQRSLPRRAERATADETLMMRDRQVIDMHWLHCRGKRDELPNGDFADLFLSDEFDFDLAAKLAEKVWKAEVKATNVLNLIPHEQLQLACLRTKAVADLWRNAENSMQTTIDRRLREQAVSERSLRPHIEDMKLLWLADKLVGKDGLVAVGQMHGWLTGQKPLATSTLSLKLKRMRRRTVSRGSERQALHGSHPARESL